MPRSLPLRSAAAADGPHPSVGVLLPRARLIHPLSGIGRATSLALAASSSPTFNVVLVGRRQAELDETARLCQAAAGEGKGQVLSLSADVGTEEGVERVFAKAKETFGESPLSLAPS